MYIEPSTMRATMSAVLATSGSFLRSATTACQKDTAHSMPIDTKMYLSWQIDTSYVCIINKKKFITRYKIQRKLAKRTSQIMKWTD